MSYLNPLRLHFSGSFQAAISTVNNDPVHYDSASFQRSYQQPQSGEELNGWFSPEGSGDWRLADCVVTAAFLADGTPAKPVDPVRAAMWPTPTGRPRPSSSTLTPNSRSSR